MGRPQSISSDAMLAAAREIFLRHGSAGSTREIAKLAGISEAALFKRFSTKAQLFMTAMAPPIPAIAPLIAEAEAAPSARQGLEKIAYGVLDYFRMAIPMILPLVAHASFTAADLPRNFETSPATALLKAVAAHLRRENARGRLTANDPVAAAGVFVSALHSIALFEIMGFHGGVVPKAGVRALVDALWHGLEPHAVPAKRRSKSK
jgi:AcrR family transcriptional regulator